MCGLGHVIMLARPRSLFFNSSFILSWNQSKLALLIHLLIMPYFTYYIGIRVTTDEMDWKGVLDFEPFPEILSCVACLSDWGLMVTVLDRSEACIKLIIGFILISSWTWMCGLSFDYDTVYCTNYISIHVRMRMRLDRIFRFCKITRFNWFLFFFLFLLEHELWWCHIGNL